MRHIPPPYKLKVIKKNRRFGKDSIDEYIDSKREDTDGCLTSDDLVRYNIFNDQETDTLTRMCAYERFLIEECRWRYPNWYGKILNVRESDAEWKEFVKTMYQLKKEKGEKLSKAQQEEMERVNK